jgi:hypothetical protein
VHAHTTGGGEKGICYVESRAQIKTTLTLTRIHRAALAVRAGVSIYLLSDHFMPARPAQIAALLQSARSHTHTWCCCRRVPYFPSDRTSMAAGKHRDGKATRWIRHISNNCKIQALVQWFFFLNYVVLSFG